MIRLKCWPTVSHVITSEFGPRLRKEQTFHSGLDLRAPVGTPGFAVADGTVVVSKVDGSGINKGYGNYMMVQHDGFCVTYAHLKQLGLPVGTKVKAGDTICYTGNTGDSDAAHLHFEIREGKYSIDYFKTDAKGMKLCAVDPKPFLMEIGKETVSENKKLSIDMVSKGLAKDAEYWEAVFDGRRVADPEYIKTVMKNAVEKIK